MKNSLIAILFGFVALFSTPAVAGQQFIDNSGYAISGYDVVSYWDLKQSAIGSPQPGAIPGKKNITTKYNGVNWAFSSVANKEKFLKDPTKYLPAFDGHCAYGIAQGGKVPTNPNLWRIVDGKLYLNITKTVSGLWEEDVPGFIKTAEKNWTALKTQSSPKRNAPDFETKYAPL